MCNIPDPVWEEAIARLEPCERARLKRSDAKAQFKAKAKSRGWEASTAHDIWWHLLAVTFKPERPLENNPSVRREAAQQAKGLVRTRNRSLNKEMFSQTDAASFGDSALQPFARAVQRGTVNYFQAYLWTTIRNLINARYLAEKQDNVVDDGEALLEWLPSREPNPAEQACFRVGIEMIDEAVRSSRRFTKINRHTWWLLRLHEFDRNAIDWQALDITREAGAERVAALYDKLRGLVAESLGAD